MKPLKNGNRDVPNLQVELSSTDLAIIRCLQRDARGSLVKVAKSLKLPESTVRNRFNQLVKQRLIEFALVNNPLKFGYPIWAIFEIQVQPIKIRPSHAVLPRCRMFIWSAS